MGMVVNPQWVVELILLLRLSTIFCATSFPELNIDRMHLLALTQRFTFRQTGFVIDLNGRQDFFAWANDKGG